MQLISGGKFFLVTWLINQISKIWPWIKLKFSIGQRNILWSQFWGSGIQKGNIFTQLKSKFGNWSSVARDREWMEIKSIGDSALFLGDNTSLSAMASNCIYCPDDYDGIPIGPLGPRDAGLYNMESGSFTPHYRTDDVRLLKMAKRPPIWLFHPLSLSR